LQRYAYRPDVVVGSLAEFSALLEETDGRPPWQVPKGRAGHEKRPLALARS
jgi:NagD protein